MLRDRAAGRKDRDVHSVSQPDKQEEEEEEEGGKKTDDTIDRMKRGRARGRIDEQL